jgi:phosphatidylglycerol:prolipoprotein diacylglycerol transferase
MFLGFQFQSPGPIIFEFGLLVLRWYGFLIASAVLIGVFLAQKLAKLRQVDPELIGDLAICQWPEYAPNPWDIIAIWKGGIAIHGAIIGGAIAALIFARIHKLSFWQLADLVVPSLILGQAIGRWGNFFNSEAFGSPTDVPWKLFILPSRRPLEYLAYDYFHPTFLYESIWNLLVFILLIYLFFRGLKKGGKIQVGTIALVYLIAYSSGRIWIEALRTDSLMLGPLRIAQIVSLGAIAFGLLGLWCLYGLKRPLPDVINSH